MVVKPSSGMVDMEEDRVVVQFSATVEVADGVVVEKDVDEERWEAKTTIQFCDLLGDGILLGRRESADRRVNSPARHFAIG